MSAWKLIARDIYEHGPATSAQIELRLHGHVHSHSATGEARRLGVVASPGRGVVGLWRLTPLGVDWCEGRVTQIEMRPGGRRWVSTWLASLPRDIRINPPVMWGGTSGLEA